MKLLAQSNYHLKYDKMKAALKRLEGQGSQIYKGNTILSTDLDWLNMQTQRIHSDKESNKCVEISLQETKNKEIKMLSDTTSYKLFQRTVN